MAASYPTSAKTFTTKVDGPGNTVMAAHINDMQDEITAIEQDLLGPFPVARGGTGQSGSGTAGQVLTSQGAGQPMIFADASGNAADSESAVIAASIFG